ncbi:MAG: histidine kinase, partial [candidate division NC10 bacterium]|nr:histidine kinase [candidate division NC10 bacterium]
ADANQIQQIIVNLLLNANDAIGERGGAVTLATTLRTNGDGAQVPGPAVEISVRDTGCGIPPANLDRIFEPFFSTKGRKGTGLGLAVAWGIVEKHNGRIEVESEVGKGTAFRVLLPVGGL